MMREERFKSILGILMMPVLMLVVVGFCMGRAQTRTEEVKSGIWAENGNSIMGTTLEERGYIMYQPLPQGVKELFDQGVLVSPLESADDNQTVEDDTDRLSSYDRIERGDYLKMNPLTVKKSEVLLDFVMNMNGELSFDPQQGKFALTDQISKIEAAGFTGFKMQLEKAAQMIQYCNKSRDKWQEGVENVYYFYCQGVEFALRETSDHVFQLSVQINFSSCYMPAKYQEFVKDVVSGGDYFLYTSTVGGDIETLTFCKDNSISLLSGRQDEELGKMVDGKQIVFMFREGKMIDYYITVQGGELELDNSDKNLIDKCAKGLGKGYPDKASMTFSGYGVFNIYRGE